MAEEDRAEEDPRHLLRQETEEDTEVRLLRHPEEAVGMSRPEADVKAGMNRLMAEDTAVLLRDAGTEEAPRPRRRPEEADAAACLQQLQFLHLSDFLYILR